MWIAFTIEFLIIVIISLLWVHIQNDKNNNYDEND
jgi:hypothetical protein